MPPPCSSSSLAKFLRAPRAKIEFSLNFLPRAIFYGGEKQKEDVRGKCHHINPTIFLRYFCFPKNGRYRKAFAKLCDVNFLTIYRLNEIRTLILIREKRTPFKICDGDPVKGLPSHRQHTRVFKCKNERYKPHLNCFSVLR